MIMLFGLKHAGATYQRLVDRMFKEQLGRIMDVYVDDMLIKSTKAEAYVSDLQKLLESLGGMV